MRRRLIRRRSRPETGPRTGTAGLTLLELAVAILVLALGSLAALGAADQSRRAIGGEAPRLLARIAARNRAEELQLLGTGGAALPVQVTLGGQVFSLASQSEPTAAGLIRTTITARADRSGQAASLVVYLTPEPRR